MPEVRIEVATFYGDLNSVEARYPGLDYCYPPHRLRLGRFKHHRRLFRAFEALCLTEQEIQELCCWEGSKWARQKYEEDQGVKVIDTTGDDIAPWIDPRAMTVEERARMPPSRKLHKSQPLPNGTGSWLSTLTAPSYCEQQSTSYEQSINVPLSSSLTQPTALIESTALRELQDQLLQAWANGQDVPAHVEALVKDHVERGDLPEDFFTYARHAARRQRLL